VTGGDVLRIGTRGSALASWQARHVAARLEALPDRPAIELVEIQTEGDRSVLPLWSQPGKAFFTKEIEQALLDGLVDVAVHSLKDLATELPPGLAIGAVLQREDPRDVLLSRHGGDLDALPAGARVGTSSLRRHALLARWRGDLVLPDLRGNVPTRIDRLDAGDFDAIVLAAAGVKRLGLEGRVGAFLPPARFPPAVGQGAIALQVRADDHATLRRARLLDDAATRRAVSAERALLRRLEGGCQVPVGALATELDGTLSLSAVVCSLDGRRSVEGRREGAAARAEELGRSLAGELLDRGAEEILAAIRTPAGGRS